MDPFVKFLTKGTLPNNLIKVKKFKWKASQFVFLDGQLHKRSFSFLLLKCCDPSKSTMCSRRSMKESVGIIWGTGPWPTKLYGRDTTDSPCKRVPWSLFESTTSASAMPTSNSSRQASWPNSLLPSYLLSRE